MGASIPLGLTSYNYGSHRIQAIETDSLWSDDVLFPLSTGLRVSSVCRMSDQTAIEASGWGLQQWSVGRTIYGDPAEETVLANSSWLQMSSPLLLGGFDNDLGYTYSSQVANVEINQRRMLLLLRSLPGVFLAVGRSLLLPVGRFYLVGSDLYSGDYENLNWQTTNNLIGMQLGCNGPGAGTASN